MADAELKRALVQSLEWVGDRADPSEWWRSPSLFAEITRALAHLHDAEAPTVVAGTQSRGMLLGGAVALHLGVGFVEIRKDRKADPHGLGLLRRSAPPDYAERDLTLTLATGRRATARPRPARRRLDRDRRSSACGEDTRGRRRRIVARSRRDRRRCRRAHQTRSQRSRVAAHPRAELTAPPTGAVRTSRATGELVLSTSKRSDLIRGANP